MSEGTPAPKPQLLASGTLMKQGNVMKNWKRRHFELTSDGMLIYLTAHSGTQKGKVDLKTAKAVVKGEEIEPVGGWPEFSTSQTGFVIRIPGRDYFILASTESERDGWLTRLSKFAPLESLSEPEYQTPGSDLP
eukprot:m.38092 g.38092  ORF g.38092 m.38092 type:complete len:134 (+) comp10156_c0_seq8:283-684(+)